MWAPHGQVPSPLGVRVEWSSVIAPVSIEAADDAFAVGEHDGVVILIWRGRPTLARVSRSVDAFAGVVQRRAPRPVSMLAVVEARSPSPDLSTMLASARGLDAHAEAVAATVAVLEDRAATSLLLDAIARVNALRRRPTPTKFCAEVREAATWLVARHPHDLAGQAPRDALVSAVEEVRRHIV